MPSLSILQCLPTQADNPSGQLQPAWQTTPASGPYLTISQLRFKTLKDSTDQGRVRWAQSAAKTLRLVNYQKHLRTQSKIAICLCPPEHPMPRPSTQRVIQLLLRHDFVVFLTTYLPFRGQKRMFFNNLPIKSLLPTSSCPRNY